MFEEEKIMRIMNASASSCKFPSRGRNGSVRMQELRAQTEGGRRERSGTTSTLGLAHCSEHRQPLSQNESRSSSVFLKSMASPKADQVKDQFQALRTQSS